jgi:hypothetical protein
MKKRFWLSYDLGIDGDYDGLYGWLDRIKAIECGDGLASFALDVGKSRDIPGKGIVSTSSGVVKIRK